MSMISSLCDELRAMAESVGLAMPQTATLMMEAADTILELRESVHRERSEADGLRMRITSLEAALEGMHLIREQDMDENAKLRELLRDMWRFTGTACKKYPRLFDPVAQGGQMVRLNAIDSFEQRMRELEIEVEQ